MSQEIFWPVLGGGTVTSRPGIRSSPGGIGSTNHKGLDIGASRGTPVIAPIGGVVESAGVAGGFGNLVQVRTQDNTLLRFAHLDSINVVPGQTIGGGIQLGTVGSTGNSTGPHLHFEVRDQSGNVLNPEGFLKGAARVGLGEARKIGKSALDNAKAGINVALRSNPATAPFAIGADALGINPFGGKSWLEQLQDWIRESGIFQRLAIAILAFVFIAVALTMLGRGQIVGNVASIVKGK